MWTRRHFSDNDAILPRLPATRQPRRSHDWRNRDDGCDLRSALHPCATMAAQKLHTLIYSRRKREVRSFLAFLTFSLSNTFGKLREVLSAPSRNFNSYIYIALIRRVLFDADSKEERGHMTSRLIEINYYDFLMNLGKNIKVLLCLNFSYLYILLIAVFQNWLYIISDRMSFLREFSRARWIFSVYVYVSVFIYIWSKKSLSSLRS